MDSGVVVLNNNEGNSTSEKRVFSYGYLPLRKLEDSYPESYESLVELFKPIGDNFFGKIISKDWSSSGTYISNVIVFSDNRERDVLYQYLLEQGGLFRRDLFGFSFDDDHVHIIHSCAFSSSQCKCKWRKEIPCGDLRPGYKYRSNLREWRRRDFLGAIIYFFFCKGGRKDAWIEGRRQRLEDNRKYQYAFSIIYSNCIFLLTVEGVQWQEVEEKVWNMLGSLDDSLRHNIRYGERDEEFSGPSNSSRKRRNGYETQMQENKKGKPTKWQIISRKVSDLLERTAICPLEGIKNEKCFLEDDYLTDPDNSNRVNEAIKFWANKINNYTLKDFYLMYLKTNGNTLMGKAYNTFLENYDSEDILNHKTQLNYKLAKEEYSYIFSRSKVYYSLEESTLLLDRLLKYQFDDDEVEIASFLQHLVNVVDFQPPNNPYSNIKCNTFLVYSPPSAGKNFFFDTLLTLCLNLGQLGTANKSNNFAFQDAANRRIILWNEPNYESSMTDYLKTLFEGGDTKVRVKMLGDTHVKRTPIIILTNNIVNFMSDRAFTERIKQYRWKAAPFLKDCLLKPYPLSFFEILLKYKIKF